MPGTARHRPARSTQKQLIQLAPTRSVCFCFCSPRLAVECLLSCRRASSRARTAYLPTCSEMSPRTAHKSQVHSTTKEGGFQTCAAFDHSFPLNYQSRHVGRVRYIKGSPCKVDADPKLDPANQRKNAVPRHATPRPSPPRHAPPRPATPRHATDEAELSRTWAGGGERACRAILGCET